MENFSTSKEKNLTMKRNLEIKLNESQREYNNEYDLGAEASINGMKTFLAELDKLEKSKIVEYERMCLMIFQLKSVNLLNSLKMK